MEARIAERLDDLRRRNEAARAPGQGRGSGEG
jgi:hypothetical protein